MPFKVAVIAVTWLAAPVVAVGVEAWAKFQNARMQIVSNKRVPPRGLILNFISRFISITGLRAVDFQWALIRHAYSIGQVVPTPVVEFSSRSLARNPAVRVEPSLLPDSLIATLGKPVATGW